MRRDVRRDVRWHESVAEPASSLSQQARECDARDDAGGDAATRRGETDDADETTERRYDAFMRAVDEYEDVEEAEEEEEDDGEEARRWAAMLGKRRDE